MCMCVGMHAYMQVYIAFDNFHPWFKMVVVDFIFHTVTLDKFNFVCNTWNFYIGSVICVFL